MTESIDSKLISVRLIIDYSLIADLDLSVYGRAECSISLECTKVKLLILDNLESRVKILIKAVVKCNHE